MITMVPLPSWRQLLINNKLIHTSSDTIWGNAQNSLFFSKGAYALKCVIMFFHSQYPTRKVCIYVPDFFCAETISEFEMLCDIVYYPIGNDLNPIYRECNQLTKSKQPDIFLLVHYFGHAADAAQAYNFCKQNNCELVEDAAHVLYPTKGIGEKGVFTLFSPHKLLPIPDGSILVINANNCLSNKVEITFNIINDFKASVENGKPNVNILRWKIKKIIQKLFFLRISLPHFNKISSVVDTDKKILIPSISNYSYQVLTKFYTKIDIAKLGEERKYKYKLWSYLICKTYDVQPLFNNTTNWIPYIAGFIDNSSNNKDHYIKNINLRWHIADTWPDLPTEVIYNPSDVVRELSQKLFICSLHHSIPISEILAVFKFPYSKLAYPSIRDKLVKENPKLTGKYDTNLIQSDEYINAKKKLDKWKIQHIKLLKDDSLIGYYNCLIKNYGIKIARINRGPILVNNIEMTYEDKYNLLKLIKKRYCIKKGYILLLAPNLTLSGENIELMGRLNYKYRNLHWSSGKVSLVLTEEELKKQLSSKWRNLLKTAEKYACQIIIDNQNIHLNTLLKLHATDKEIRNYQDSGEAIVEELGISHRLVSYIAFDDDCNVLSFVIIALHGEFSCTYLIGWNSELGYKFNLNRRLLWTAMLDMKARGRQYFDLGGIDAIHTPNVANFKLGINSDFYELIGEYISL